MAVDSRNVIEKKRGCNAAHDHRLNLGNYGGPFFNDHHWTFGEREKGGSLKRNYIFFPWVNTVTISFPEKKEKKKKKIHCFKHRITFKNAQKDTFKGVLTTRAVFHVPWSIESDVLFLWFNCRRFNADLTVSSAPAEDNVDARHRGVWLKQVKESWTAKA